MDLHLVPLPSPDEPTHVETADCWCEPTIMLSGDGDRVFIHADCFDLPDLPIPPRQTVH